MKTHEEKPVCRESRPTELTFEQAEELCKKTDYAIEAVGDEINWGDAAAFFLEGYRYAQTRAALKNVDHFAEAGKMIMGLLEDFEDKELSKREVWDRIMDFANHVPDAGEKVERKRMIYKVERFDENGNQYFTEDLI